MRRKLIWSEGKEEEEEEEEEGVCRELIHDSSDGLGLEGCLEYRS